MIHLFRRMVIISLLLPFPWFLGEFPLPLPGPPPSGHNEQGPYDAPSTPPAPAEPCLNC